MASGKICTSSALWLPSARGIAVTSTNEPCLMSESDALTTPAICGLSASAAFSSAPSRDFTRNAEDKETDMSDWLHNLPVLWMGLVVFGFTYLVTAGIYVAVTAFAVGERARSFKAISPGLLPPLGIIFGLFVAFTAAQVWNDNERANAAVNREASALRAVVVLAANLPEEPKRHLRNLIRRYIQEVTTQEWPMMAQGTATLRATPSS